MNTRFAAALAMLFSTVAAPSLAQTPAERTGDHHAEPPPVIVITAMERNRDDFLGGVSVLADTDLDAAKRPTIGETLAGLPGVSATSFGPSASRPVLRGFQGDRIRVLTDGIGSFDASGSSVDHAVAINPLIAERIEVLRGPAALLYGSSAIGGVVNVINSRIPRKIPNEIVHFDADVDYSTASDERRGGAVLDVPIGGGFVVHVDGSYARSDDLETGGFLLGRDLREQAAASSDPEIRELATRRGRLPNTAAKSSEVAGGLSYIADGGNLGVAVSRYDNRYGVPIRFSLDPAVEAEAPMIDVLQYRADLRAEIDVASGFLDKVRFRAGYGDYRHFEIEDSGEIATIFLNDGMEGRLEFVQRDRDGWSGAFGGQILARDFEAIGEEAFLPPTRTEQAGVFAVQNFDLGGPRIELGARFEQTRVEADPSESLGTIAGHRRFGTVSGSAGASVALFGRWRAGINLSHSERAPTADELFANGPHLATQAFEVGDRDFTKEKSNGGELTLHGRGSGYTIRTSAYYNHFSNFIFLGPNGDAEDGLPVFQYQSTGATQWGIEGEATLTLATLGEGRVVADVVGDYVRVTLNDVGPAPFIPPLRVLGGIEYQADELNARAEVEHVTGQDRIAAFETTTPAHTLANARVKWRPMGPDGLLTLRLAANNIFDVTARRHASFLKDYAPLAGRDIRIGASIRF